MKLKNLSGEDKEVIFRFKISSEDEEEECNDEQITLNEDMDDEVDDVSSSLKTLVEQINTLSSNIETALKLIYENEQHIENEILKAVEVLKNPTNENKEELKKMKANGFEGITWD